MIIGKEKEKNKKKEGKGYHSYKGKITAHLTKTKAKGCVKSKFGAPSEAKNIISGERGYLVYGPIYRPLHFLVLLAADPLPRIHMSSPPPYT